MYFVAYHGELLDAVCQRFLESLALVAEQDRQAEERAADGAAGSDLGLEVLVNHVRQAPQYSLAALREGVYLIGMKDQLNMHDLPSHPMHEHVQYVADEMGFILFDRTQQDGAVRSIDRFGPYFIEQYIVMELLSKQEVAQNVLEYYVHQREKLRQGVAGYSEAQGQGFICWRFINERRGQQAQAPLTC